MNLKVRFRNPVFIAQLFLSVLMPVLTYSGLTVQDITTWQTLGNLLYNALGNPYVLGLIAVSVWNALTDPTTAGLGDSSRAMTYEKPYKDKG
jgi:phi LC3 family holin